MTVVRSPALFKHLKGHPRRNFCSTNFGLEGQLGIRVNDIQKIGILRIGNSGNGECQQLIFGKLGIPPIRIREIVFRGKVFLNKEIWKIHYGGLKVGKNHY